MVRLLVNRYAAGPRAAYKGAVTVGDPETYPEVGCYHPSLGGRGITEKRAELPARGKAGTVGLLLGRSYLLAGNTAHYDAVIAALEARGLTVVPAFASGLDARAAIETYFLDQKAKLRGSDKATIDALVSLTGFSLVGGPAYNDAEAAQAVLGALDVPYLSLQTLEFQTVGEWEQDPTRAQCLAGDAAGGDPRARWRDRSGWSLGGRRLGRSRPRRPSLAGSRCSPIAWPSW